MSKDQQVTAALREAEERGEVITKAAIARKSGVSLSYIRRHPQLCAAIERAGEPGMADRDKRLIPVTVKFSPHVLELIRQADAAEGQFIWDAVVEVLAGRLGVDVDDVDPVRRQARRRGNYAKRRT